MGAIFRTADAVAAEHIHLGGITATPPHPRLMKTALGSTDWVPWSHHPKTPEAIRTLRELGYSIVCLEQSPTSRPIGSVRFPARVASILTNHEHEETPW